MRRLAKVVSPWVPTRIKSALRARVAPGMYAVNTSGLHPASEMIAWVAQHPRGVSIVIPSYNDVPFLTKCLQSIERTCRSFDYEVIVVDDFCEPENAAVLASLQDDHVRVILKEKRQGFAVAVNVGMAEARHDIVLLNSDIVAQNGWLEALQYGAYAVDGRIGMVSPKLVYPDGRIQYGGTYYARVLAPQWFGHLHVGAPASKPVANVAGYNRSVSGACVYVTRAAYEAVGPLDEAYWLGFEDVDWGLKAWSEGFRCYYQPASMLVHHESASRGYSQGWRELASMRYFWSKWSPRFLERKLPEMAPLDYVISEQSSDHWKQYVHEQTDRLRIAGYRVEVHQIVSGVDETVVAALLDRPSVKICCDWGAASTTWLAASATGVPVYLLPGVESGAFPDDPSLQARIVSGYRPEFDYIAPNRWTADQLRAEAAWETTRRVVPVLRPPELRLADSSGDVVTFGLSASQRAVVDGIAREFGVQSSHFAEAVTGLDRVRRVQTMHPRVIVCSTEFDSALVPLGLMSSGAALVTQASSKTRYEILDGFNALLFEGADDPAMGRAVRDILSRDPVWRELATNGHGTAHRWYDVNANEMSSAIEAISRVAY